MGRKVFVVGVGMTKFEKPGKRDWDYPDMVKEAVEQALADAKLKYTDVQQVTVGYVNGDSTCGQRAIYQLGLTGVPVYNVNNNCATGSTALFMAKQFVEGGISDCVLAVGFEKMERGSLSSKYEDRVNPMDRHMEVMIDLHGFAPAPATAQIFGNAGREHNQKYGSNPDHFAKIALKNHKHSVQNERAQFRDDYTLEQIKKSKMIHEPLTMLQCSPTSDGSAAAILCSQEFVEKHGLQANAVEVLGMSMATDLPSVFSEDDPANRNCINMIGFDMAKKASQEAYRQAGVGPTDIQVIELHDCFSCNELITYESLGLAPVGKGHEIVDRGDNTYGGKWVINPSGGLESKGHPLGATGLAQCAEISWQLRGLAGPRQVPNCKIGLQHNLGLGGAVVIGIYKKAYGSKL
eukprot:TRINITY_DN14471_c0_g1_i1.p1 TRINITY_DN14471_c0_g1~~TRINITY_DN14471_c0_g1_i1.p1  ORF type:complete len:406 (-),score=96.44 TRINITY_DN14471_c0_g1_i1:164-1381(-)